jgi:hypothetical protein
LPSRRFIRPEGFQKVIDIINADDQLVSSKNKMKFGGDNFYLALFGKPSTTEPWMVQFGGHHLGLNVTVVGKEFVLTPTHTGAQPTSFTRKGKTVRPLGPENDLAFKLINMLDAKQQAQNWMRPTLPGTARQPMAAPCITGCKARRW